MVTDGSLETHRIRYQKGTGCLRPPKETDKVSRQQDRLSKVSEGITRMNDDQPVDWERYTQDEIKRRMKDMSGDTCRVCFGLVDHHSDRALRIHLKILSRRTNPKRNMIGGLIFGGSIAVSIYLLAHWIF